jgi:hypothetical protein
MCGLALTACIGESVQTQDALEEEPGPLELADEDLTDLRMPTAIARVELSATHALEFREIATGEVIVAETWDMDLDRPIVTQRDHETGALVDVYRRAAGDAADAPIVATLARFEQAARLASAETQAPTGLEETDGSLTVDRIAAVDDAVYKTIDDDARWWSRNFCNQAGTTTGCVGFKGQNFEWFRLGIPTCQSRPELCLLFDAIIPAGWTVKSKNTSFAGANFHFSSQGRLEQVLTDPCQNDPLHNIKETIERVFPEFNKHEAMFTDRLDDAEVHEMARLLRLVTATASDKPLVAGDDTPR